MKAVILIVLFLSLLHAAPAREMSYELTQESGEQFRAKQRGDEYLHWIETENSDILIYNKKSGNYEYAVIEGDELKPSKRAYKKSRGVRSIKADVLELWQKKRKEAHMRLHRR